MGEMMRFLAVDDENMMLEKLVSTLRSVRPEAEIFSYTWPDDALAAVKQQPVDVAFLDIEMGDMTGLELAARLKKVQSDIHIIFVTGYDKYAVDAFALHATGYLLKPVNEEAIKRELTFVYSEPKIQSRIKVQTFGGFEFFVDGQPVKFGRIKAKELLAYLIDHRGAAVTAGDICAALFEDVDDKTAKGNLRVLLHELKKSLKTAGIEEMLIKGHNSYAIAPDGMDCDFYRFLQGDPIAVNAYQNDYLPAYSWAEIRNAELGFRNT
ncbi:MAG: response regulator [Acutalibacteraceae bacterium]